MNLSGSKSTFPLIAQRLQNREKDFYSKWSEAAFADTNLISNRIKAKN